MGSTVMSDQDDWDFAGADDAKADIRAAVEYLLKGTTGPARDVIALEIIKIVHQVANGLPLLPHGEFRQAMQTFYAATKGKRARDLMEEGRFSFSAWGVEFRRELATVVR